MRSIFFIFLFFLTVSAGAQTNCTLKSSGDANCDSGVDLADFETWRKEYMGIISSTTADFNNDGSVSLPDFEVWRKAYTNQTSPSPTLTITVTVMPTRIITDTITPAGPTPTGSQTTGQGIVVSPDQLTALPIAGQNGCAPGTLCANAWNAIIAKAESNWGNPDIDTYDLPHEEGVVAA